jgi:hypothetical protein
LLKTLIEQPPRTPARLRRAPAVMRFRKIGRTSAQAGETGLAPTLVVPCPTKSSISVSLPRR